jgi:hypothetical protein
LGVEAEEEAGNHRQRLGIKRPILTRPHEAGAGGSARLARALIRY